MLQLIYTSVSADDWDGDLQALRDQAAQNNVSDEITGVLLLRHSTFLQALEGPQMPVEDAFIRIIGDTRHHSLKLLSRRTVTRRNFGDNPMARLIDQDEEDDAIRIVGGMIVDAPLTAQAVFRERFGDLAAVRVRHP